MRASDLHNIRKVLRLLLQRLLKPLKLANRAALNELGASNVHSSRKRVVAALAHIDMIIGVHGRLAAHLSAQDLYGAVGHNLVDVHVALRAGSRLEDNKREHLVVLASDDLVARLRDGLENLLRDAPFGTVVHGATLFDGSHRVDDLQRHPVLARSDREVLKAPLCLLRANDGRKELEVSTLRHPGDALTAPHSLELSTSILPMLSDSILVDMVIYGN